MKKECNRCGWKWWARSAKRPRVCPACNSPYWDKRRKYHLKKGPKAKPRYRGVGEAEE